MNREFTAGVMANLPVAFSVSAYGSVLGVLAAQKGITFLELLLMNVAVFAGSAQFVLIDMWQPPFPILEIGLAVLVINLRYVLIGASLRPIFSGAGPGTKLGVMHLAADENWAVTMAAYQKGEAVGPQYLLGGGVCLILAWCAGTLLGHSLGAAIQNPEAYALDFAFIAVFTALSFSMWTGKENIIPWLSAVLLAIVTEQFIPGKWYVLVGGVGGAAVQAMMFKEEGEACHGSE